LMKEGKIVSYVEKYFPPDEAGQQLLFSELKRNFQGEAKLKPEITDAELLRRWRRPVWIQLILVIFMLTLGATMLLWFHSWNILEATSTIAQNRLLTASIAAGWFILSTFCIKDLYNKYKNHSNINAFLTQARQGKK